MQSKIKDVRAKLYTWKGPIQKINNNFCTSAADLLNKEMLIGLAIVNPIYFFCMMIGAMKNLAVSISVILGTILGPVIYIFSSEWSLLFAGLIAGSVAFLFGEKNGQ